MIHSNNVVFETASTVDGVRRSAFDRLGRETSITNHPMITKRIHCLSGPACVKFSVMILLSPNASLHG
ncbi:hypothetical protein C9417_02585 [Rhizobium sp. SEMIA 4088]|nr:hypothetical protein C9417_02585 [Rhizobium sp. SEMIA 4088]